MKLKKTFFSISLMILIYSLWSCNSNFRYRVEKRDHSVVIHQDSIIITVEIIDESIIHVKKELEGNKGSTIPDYVTVLEPQDVVWKLHETEDQIIISTNTLKVLVNSDGTIEYQSKENKKLLAESNQNTFVNPGKDGEHTVSQAFYAGDEGLYGLGQFQSGIMNWKNVPIRLQQYNQEIAIPFLVSTKGYGIYWNNYSITDFNYAENEIEFTSSNKNLDSNNKDLEPVTEKENVVEYATALKVDKNIRETIFTPSQTGEYSFMALSDHKGRMRGKITVTIDDDEIINYSTIWMPTRYSGKKHLEAGKAYKVVFQNTGTKIPGKLFYNAPNYNKTVFSSLAGNAIDYYFVHGDKPAAVLSEYHKLTGRTPMFAKKSYGFWQCRERYHNQDELLENARAYREKEIPVDNIVQDWFYWPKKKKGPEWDRKKYPNPKAMVDELTDLNYNLMVSVWPEVKNDRLEEKYNLIKLKGCNNVDIYDTINSERYYRMLSDSMFHIGVKSIWLDGTEPEGKPEKGAQTAVGPYAEVNNVYSLVVSKTMYEGRRKEYPKERVFNLTRSAYAGQQRYGAASWSGDVAGTWEQFAEQIPAGLNFTMAGVPYWTHDIGGFFRDSKSLNPIYDSQYSNQEYIELLTRWFQFGTFSPIFRIHGYVSETEIWRYGQEFEDMARKFIDLRYQLMPYIYSEAWKVTNESQLLMSPLAYYYPNDKNTWAIKDQLFFGESMMVSLVTEYKERSKVVYLPQGSWYNFWTNEKVLGGKKVKVDAALNSTPIFVKAGSIIPMGPKVQYATQKSDEPIQIKIYPGKDAEYVLYLDDNESYGYEKGEFSEIILFYSESEKSLIIKKGEGEFINFEKNPMKLSIELIGSSVSDKVTFKGESLTIKLK